MSEKDIIELVIRKVCQRFQISYLTVLGTSKKRRESLYRHITILLAWMMIDRYHSEAKNVERTIAEYFRCHRTTVISAHKQARVKLSSPNNTAFDKYVKKEVDSLELNLIQIIEAKKDQKIEFQNHSMFQYLFVIDNA